MIDAPCQWAAARRSGVAPARLRSHGARRVRPARGAAVARRYNALLNNDNLVLITAICLRSDVADCVADGPILYAPSVLITTLTFLCTRQYDSCFQKARNNAALKKTITSPAPLRPMIKYSQRQAEYAFKALKRRIKSNVLIKLRNALSNPVNIVLLLKFYKIQLWSRNFKLCRG